MLPQLGENQVQDDDAWAKPMNLAPDWNAEDPEVRSYLRPIPLNSRRESNKEEEENPEVKPSTNKTPRPAARPRLVRARPKVSTAHVLYVYRIPDSGQAH